MSMLPTEGRRSDFCANKSNNYYADPEDCSNFYHCHEQITYPKHCPHGLFYNEIYMVCDWPDSVVCGQRVIPSENQDPEPSQPFSATTSSTLMMDSTTESKGRENSTYNPNSPFFTFCHGKANTLYPDPEDCHSFYQCHYGASFHQTCQSNLVFNPGQLYCDWAWNVECSTPINNPDRSQDFDLSTQTGSTSAVSIHQAETCGKVICYFPNWAIYRRGVGARFGPENVNPGLCTHLIYAFATLLDNRLVASDSADEARGSDIGNFARATQLKKQNPQLKVLIAVGGWKMDPHQIYNMASSEKSRAEFIASTIEFLRLRNFDGLSLDWNNAGGAVGHDIFKDLYTRLCQELRSAFDNEASGDKRLLLTGAVSVTKTAIDTAYDIPRLATALDVINVMSYDFHGTWDGRTGHGSPLKAGSWEGTEAATLNVEWVANYLASKGAPKNKLAIGVPLYARTFTLSSTFNTEVGAPITGPGLPGKHTSEYGYLSYNEVCLLMSSSNKFFIESQRVPYLVSGNQWVGYEDSASVKEKAQFITENGYAGIMIWDISLDDWRGSCGTGSNPLMNSILSQCAASGITITTTHRFP